MERMQNKEVQNIVSRVLEEKKLRDRDEDISIKKSKKFHILYDKNQSLSRKIKQLEDHHQTLKRGYGDKLIDKHFKHDDNVDKIKKLEQLESMLLDKLKQTHSR